MSWNKLFTVFQHPGQDRPGRPLCLLFILCLAVVSLAAPVPGTVRAGEALYPLGFRGAAEGEEGPVPEGWELVSYLGRTPNHFSLEKDNGGTVVRVRSRNSVSALMAAPDVDLEEYPRLAWRWKVDRVVGMAREDQRDRNDSAARVRVIFGTGQPQAPSGRELLRRILEVRGIDMGEGADEPPGLKIDYIWGNHFPPGTVIDYAGSRGHKVIFLQSGNEHARQWVREERDLLRDFRECFGGSPETLEGILVLSDTDRTNEGVTAFFGDMVLMRPEGP